MKNEFSGIVLFFSIILFFSIASCIYVVNFVAGSWTQEMAHLMGVRNTGNVFGLILMIIGLLFCGLIGLFSNSIGLLFIGMSGWVFLYRKIIRRRIILNRGKVL